MQDGSPFTITRRSVMALTAGALASHGFAVHAQEAGKRGGVLRVSAPVNPSSLDPATGGAGSDLVFLFPIYDTLIEWDFKTLLPKPGLAESWSYTDPKTLVLKLRRGITFHDGTPFDAEAVRYNIRRSLTADQSNVKADLASVASVEVTGENEVMLRLKRPDTSLPSILADRAGMMISPRAIEASGTVNRQPVGTGAYVFERWDDGERIVLRRNAKYWKEGQPYTDGIEFVIITELATGLRSVLSGQNDFIYQLSTRQMAIAKRSGNLKILTAPTLTCYQFYLNRARRPFDDLRVRQALNFAIDREAFVHVGLNGVGEPAYMNLPSTHWAYDPGLKGLYPYDPDRSRALLANAGHGELSVEFIGYNDQDSVQRQEILMEQLRRGGFKVRFINSPVAQAAGSFFGPQRQGAALLGNWTGRPDPTTTYALLYEADAYYNAGRVAGPPGLEDAIGETRSLEGLDQRKAAFAKVQRLVMENALNAPIAFINSIEVLAPKVEGFRSNLLGKPKFDGVWLER